MDGRRGEGGIRGADGLHPTPSINVGELNTRVFMYAVYHKLNPFMDVSDVAQICLLLTDFFIVWKCEKHEVVRGANKVSAVLSVYENKSCGWHPEWNS